MAAQIQSDLTVKLDQKFNFKFGKFSTPENDSYEINPAYEISKFHKSQVRDSLCLRFYV